MCEADFWGQMLVQLWSTQNLAKSFVLSTLCCTLVPHSDPISFSSSLCCPTLWSSMLSIMFSPIPYAKSSPHCLWQCCWGACWLSVVLCPVYMFPFFCHCYGVSSPKVVLWMGEWREGQRIALMLIVAGKPSISHTICKYWYAVYPPISALFISSVISTGALMVTLKEYKMHSVRQWLWG